jgi:hypothetical protein
MQPTPAFTKSAQTIGADWARMMILRRPIGQLMSALMPCKIREEE